MLSCTHPFFFLNPPFVFSTRPRTFSLQRCPFQEKKSQIIPWPSTCFQQTLKKRLTIDPQETSDHKEISEHRFQRGCNLFILHDDIFFRVLTSFWETETLVKTQVWFWIGKEKKRATPSTYFLQQNTHFLTHRDDIPDYSLELLVQVRPPLFREFGETTSFI